MKINKFNFSLTMINKCGIVIISLPVKPIVRSGRNTNVFFMSKATVSVSSSSTRSSFSFHSLSSYFMFF